MKKGLKITFTVAAVVAALGVGLLLGNADVAMILDPGTGGGR
jgi:hypothetical protein